MEHVMKNEFSFLNQSRIDFKLLDFARDSRMMRDLTSLGLKLMCSSKHNSKSKILVNALNRSKLEILKIMNFLF